MPRAYYVALAVALAFLLALGGFRCTAQHRCHTNVIGKWCDYTKEAK